MSARRVAPAAVVAAAGASAVVGAALATRPEAIAKRVAEPGDAVPHALVRVLGLRMVAQAAAELGRPLRSVLWSGACFDLAHGASMLAAGMIWPQYRRTTSTSAALAFAVGTGQLLAGRACR